MKIAFALRLQEAISGYLTKVILLFCLWGAGAPLLAAPPANSFSTIRFSALDINEDGNLYREEILFAKNEAGFWLDPQGWKLADGNHNNRLDLGEYILSESAASNFHQKADQEELKQLRSEVPYFDKIQTTYLRRQSKLAARLFANLQWSDANSRYIQVLLRDQNWWKENPEVLLGLHQNFSWLWKYPELALRLYHFPLPAGAPPALIRWRSLHQNYLTNHAESPEDDPKADEQQAFLAILENYRLAAAHREDSLTQLIAAEKKKHEATRAQLSLAQASLDDACKTLRLLETGRGGEQVSLATTVTALEKLLRKKTEEIRLSMLEEDSLLAENYRLKRDLRVAAPAPQNLNEDNPFADLQAELDDLNKKLREKETQLRTSENQLLLSKQQVAQLENTLASLSSAPSPTPAAPAFATPAPPEVDYSQEVIARLQERIADLEAENNRQQALAQRAVNEAGEWEKLAIQAQQKADSLATIKPAPPQQIAMPLARAATRDPQELSDSLQAARFQVQALEQRVDAWEKEKKLRMEAEQRARLAEMRLTEMEKQAKAKAAVPATDPRLAEAYTRIQRLEFVLRQTLEELDKFRIQEPEKSTEGIAAQAATQLQPPVGFQTVLEKYKQQEAELQIQLKNNNLYLARVVTEKKNFEAELEEAVKVQAQLAHVIDSLNRVANYRQTRLGVAVDSLRYYRTLSRKNAAMAQSWQTRYQEKQTTSSTADAGLNARIEQLEAELAAAKSAQKVDRDQVLAMEQARFALDKKQRELLEMEARLSQQQNWLNQQKRELEETARKYQDLLEKEKELKLREQRLRQAESGAAKP